MILKFSEALQEDPNAMFYIISRWNFGTELAESLYSEKVNGMSQTYVPYNAKGVIVQAMGLDIAQYCEGIIVEKNIVELQAKFEPWYRRKN